MELTGFRKNIIKKQNIYLPIIFAIFVMLLALTIAFKKRVSRDKAYVKEEYVALYIKKYHELPKNYITKDGRDYFYRHGIDSSNFIVGGDTHYNDGSLEIYGISLSTSLKECDIYFSGYDCQNRGTNRLVYEANKSNPRVFSTNHYNGYSEITKVDIMPMHYSFLIILILYSIISTIILFYFYFPYIKWFFIRNS